MSQFRFAAPLALLVVAGCYSDASQQSTLPDPQLDPQYFAGPPGGAMDPGYGYQPHADPGNGSVAQAAPGTRGGPAVSGDPDEADDSDEDLAQRDADDGAASAAPGEDSPDDSAGPIGSSGPSGSAGGPAVQAPDDPDAAGLGTPGPDDVAEAPQPAPTGTVTDPEIDAALDGYGQWIQTDDYGPVWRPDATVVGVDFTPYESGGSWVDTDAGWAFSCDYPWGWLPFHYGRWAWFHDYWGWVPGHRWGPAWVDWRHGNGVIGWRPRLPRPLDHRPSIGHHGRGVLVRDHRHAEQHDAHWRFATSSNFARPHIRSHLYGNPAEGLRVTSKVAAPPLRARTMVRAADLMRNRFSAGGRPWAQGSGRFGGQVQVRDHRGFDPARGQAVRPGPSTQDPGRFGGPQVRDHRGFDPRGTPSPGQAVRPMPPAQDSRSFGGPQVRDHRGFDPRGTPPPAQAVRPMPPAQDPRSFGGPQVRDHRGFDPRGTPPPGAYRPPVYRPGAQPSPPARTYQPQPPVRTYQPPPPVRTFQPPPRSAPMPSAPAPSHTWSPPSHSSSPPASAPSHSSSPPASAPSHSSAPSSSSGASHGGRPR